MNFLKGLFTNKEEKAIEFNTTETPLTINDDKAKVVQKRIFLAGNINTTNNWNIFNETSSAEIRTSAPTVRAKARYLANNSPYIKKYLSMLDNNIVGNSGIRLQAKAKDFNGAFDKYANTMIEDKFDEWCRKSNCDVSGRLNFIDIQRVIIKTVARDGEIFIRKVKGYNNKFKFALQLIEADYIDENYNVGNKNGIEIISGIEYDEWKKPIAYYIKQSTNSSTYNGNRIRIPADEIIHLFIADRPSQNRGISWLHAVIENLKMLDGYREAELISARVSASKGGFYKVSGGDEYVGETDTNHNLVNEIEPGTFEILPEGIDFVPYDPQHPSTAFDTFIKSALRSVASGLNVAYNTLANDLENVNFSSMRSGLLEEREIYKTLQNWFTNNCLIEVYETFLEMAILTNEITLPMSKIDKFKKVVWMTRGWQWVDPQRDAQATIMSLNAGLKTVTDILAEQGKDVEDVYAQLAEEQKLRDQYGLNITKEINKKEVLDNTQQEDN